MPDGGGYGIIGNETYVVIVSFASHVLPPPYNSSSFTLQSILYFAPFGEGVLFNDATGIDAGCQVLYTASVAF
jgi:hypothetical protein